MAASLGLFRSRPAPYVLADGAVFACCGHQVSPAERGWRVPRSPSGRGVLLSGWIDNREELSQQLGVQPEYPGALYGAAYDKWGDDADLHVIGDYSAVIDDREGRTVRLSRSPWRAPPLHYFCDAEKVVAASVPRVLHACGVPAELDRQRLIESHFLNLTSDRGWYEGCFRVRLASSVHIDRQNRKPRTYYDMLAPRETRLPKLSDYVEVADELLREACRVTLGNAKIPGILLSGGLDSSNVAARLLDCLPQDRTLKSFTFRPLAEFREPEGTAHFGDDGPAVMRFAEMHPRIEPFFSRNEEIGFDAGCEKMFLAMGSAPEHLANMYHYHSLAAEAGRQGCDLLLWADFGNITFSSEADQAFHEYLVTGKWRQWWRAVHRRPIRTRPLHRFLIGRALAPFAPDWLWRLQRRLRGSPMQSANEKIGALRQDVIETHGLREKAKEAGVYFLRERIRSRRDEIALHFSRGDGEFYDTVQGFEQIYGFDCRDVTAYRPFVEFCLGLPTGVFMHDGQNRWLARELGKGLMPEAQRLEPRQGLHSADWHERMTPRLDDIRKELELASQDPALNEILDFDSLLEAVDNWPAQGSSRDDTVFKCLMATSRAILTKRFADFVSGTNHP